MTLVLHLTSQWTESGTHSPCCSHLISAPIFLSYCQITENCVHVIKLKISYKRIYCMNDIKSPVLQFTSLAGI